MIVIHPTDITTDFLKNIYPKRTVDFILNETYSNSQISYMLNHMFENERIYMLGHGSEYGLFGTPKGQPRIIINSKHVDFLRKLECIGVWCNANMFAEKEIVKYLSKGECYTIMKVYYK